MMAGDLLVLLLAGMAAIAAYPALDALLGWLTDGPDAGERP